MASMATAVRQPRAKPASRFFAALGLAATALMAGLRGLATPVLRSSAALGGEPMELACFVAPLCSGDVRLSCRAVRLNSPVALQADKVGGIFYEPKPGNKPSDPDNEDAPVAEKKVKLRPGEETVPMQYDRVQKKAKHLRQIPGKFWYIGPKPHDKHVFRLVSLTAILNPKQAANAKLLNQVVEETRRITGQHPSIVYAKQNCVTFGQRKGDKVGVKVNIRGQKMYDFLDRLNTITLPRIRDFEGLFPNSFNKHGDFCMAFLNQEPFKELDEVIDNREFEHGFTLTIANTAMTQPDGLALMKSYGFPFTDPRPRKVKKSAGSWNVKKK